MDYRVCVYVYIYICSSKIIYRNTIYRNVWYVRTDTRCTNESWESIIHRLPPWRRPLDNASGPENSRVRHCCWRHGGDSGPVKFRLGNWTFICPIGFRFFSFFFFFFVGILCRTWLSITILLCYRYGMLWWWILFLK